MSNSKILLGVNIDHVATLRQARGTHYPDPIAAARVAEEAGADGITLHLREDRRHIQDNDVIALKAILSTRMNLEMAASPEMVAFAKRVRPHHCCLVPEKREELTTEGGLDVISHESRIRDVCQELKKENIIVSLFIDPEIKQIEAALRCYAPVIEIHTGYYADAPTSAQQQIELQRIVQAAEFAKQAGLEVNAGHGLHYQNVRAIAQIAFLTELNIGHAIIAQSVFSGLFEAVKRNEATYFSCSGC